MKRLKLKLKREIREEQKAENKTNASVSTLEAAPTVRVNGAVSRIPMTMRVKLYVQIHRAQSKNTNQMKLALIYHLMPKL